MPHSSIDWPHAPVHRLDAAGTYMVTAGTYRKERLFQSDERLQFLCASLLEFARRYGWRLQAWAVFPNHYHFVATSGGDAKSLKSLTRDLHSFTARKLNEQDGAQGRRVWFQYWESRLTYQKSYLARLHYVHSNAVVHGVARTPEDYPWCSAGWFRRKASPAFYNTVFRTPCDRINVPDDF